MKGIFLVLILTTTGVMADDLPSCNLKSFISFNITPAYKDPTYGIKGLSEQQKHMIPTEASENSNEYKSIPINDAVVNMDFENRFNVLKPSKDFKYKANFLTPSIIFKGGQEYETTLKYTNPDGLNYDVLSQGQYHIFVSENGTPCNKIVYIDYPTSVIVMHKYSIDPSDAIFEKGLSESRSYTTGIRIIYLGVDKGEMKFQRTLVSGGKVLESKEFAFEQFAKKIVIAGITIQVSKASSDSITAKVEL